MIVRLALFTMLAVGLAGFGTVAWLQTHQAAGHGTPVSKIDILVAAEPLRAGSLLQPSDMSGAPFMQADIPVGATIDTPANRTALIGAMIRQSLATGSPILPTAVIRPGDHGFLAAALQPGMRAVSVGVDAITGTAGLIWPGDRVDLLLTQTLNDPNLPVGRRVAAETVLSDVRVIAIDQRLVQGGDASAHNESLARTVTLEVSAEAAESVAVAAHLGPLSLVVRSAERPRGIAAEPPPPVWGSQVSPALAQSAAPANLPDKIEVYQGSTEKTEYNF
jgi:pilus assembly protein CpaB